MQQSMLWRILHYLVVGVYIAAPIAAIVVDAIRAKKRQRTAPGGWLVGVILTGAVVGTAMAVLYALAVGGKIRVGQAILASYFAVGMLVVLRVFDHLLQRGLRAAFRVNRTVERPSIGFRLRGLLSGLTRLAVLFGVGLPYVMATVLTYRPKVELRDDPQKQLGFKFEPVEFTATDGM